MNFRKVKYIEFVIGLILLVVGGLLYAREEKLSFVLLGILLLIDFIVRLSFKIYTNKLISNGIIVKIRQEEYKWWNTVNTVGTILIIILFVYYSINKGFLFLLDEPVIMLLYIAMSSQLFLSRKGDFYIDREGFIQPEILKSNYYWSDIGDFKLNNDSISFVLNNKEYSIEISEEVKTKLVDLANR